MATPDGRLPGRWLLCSGSGNGSAYFVPDASRQRGSRPFDVMRDNLRALALTPDSAVRRGYYSSLEDLPGLVHAIAEPRPGLVTIELGTAVTRVVGTGTNLLAVEEQLLRTVLAYKGGATLVLTLRGSCHDYRDLAESAARCEGLTADHRQPRTRL